MSKRTSVMWTIDVEVLREIVSKSSSFSDVFRHFGMAVSGASFKILKKRLDEVGIRYKHIRLGSDCNKGRKFLVTKAIPLEKVMIEGSSYCRKSLKRRLLLNGILTNICDICGQKPLWNGQPMTLILDHINGKRDDHRRENLQLVCPNCNSQLATTGGRANRKMRNCVKCGIVISQKNARYCRSCRPKHSQHHKHKSGLGFPSKDNLEQMVNNIPMTEIGKKYGVSDNAVKKWCKSYGIVIGNRRGYWQKNRSQCSCTFQLAPDSDYHEAVLKECQSALDSHPSPVL